MKINQQTDLPEKYLEALEGLVVPDTANSVDFYSGKRYYRVHQEGDVPMEDTPNNTLFDEKLGRAEDRWHHSQEKHEQRMESLFRESDERLTRSEEMNRVLIKNFSEKTDYVIKALSKDIEGKVNTLETKFDKLETKVDNLETKFDKLETKIDDAVKEIKSSNRNTAWASIALVVTVLATLGTILTTLYAAIFPLLQSLAASPK
jgi:outer membrane murein-binding lipoprotein Lpp